jgi:hypothetical protein
MVASSELAQPVCKEPLQPLVRHNPSRWAMVEGSTTVGVQLEH